MTQNEQSNDSGRVQYELDDRRGSLHSAATCLILCGSGDGQLDPLPEEREDHFHLLIQSLADLYNLPEPFDTQEMVWQPQEEICIHFEDYEDITVDLIKVRVTEIAKEISDPYLQKVVGLHCALASSGHPSDEIVREALFDEWGISIEDAKEIVSSLRTIELE